MLFICKSNCEWFCQQVEMEKYWQKKLGAGDSIIMLGDFIEAQVTYPTEDNKETFKPKEDCEVVLRQLIEEDMDVIADHYVLNTKYHEILFPADRLKELLRILRKVKEEKDGSKYEQLAIKNEVIFVKKERQDFYLVNDIVVTEIEEFCAVLTELLSVYNEMLKKCVH